MHAFAACHAHACRDILGGVTNSSAIPLILGGEVEMWGETGAWGAPLCVSIPFHFLPLTMAPSLTAASVTLMLVLLLDAFACLLACLSTVSGRPQLMVPTSSRSVFTLACSCMIDSVGDAAAVTVALAFGQCL